MLVISPEKNGVRRASRPTMTRIASGRRAVLGQREPEVGDVHQQVARAEVPGEPAQPFEVGLDLARALERRGVQRGERAPPGDRIGRRGRGAPGSVGARRPAGRRRVLHLGRRRTAVRRWRRGAGAATQPADCGRPRAASARGDERPAPGGGDRPLGGEGVAQQAVVVAHRGQGGDRGGEVAVLEGGVEQEDQVAPPAGDVPLGFEGFRVHPSGRQVRGVEEEGVREQQVEVDRIAAGVRPAASAASRSAGRQPREQGVDRRGVVLGGAEPFAIGGSQSGQEGVDLRGQPSARRSRRDAARARRRRGAAPRRLSSGSPAALPDTAATGVRATPGRAASRTSPAPQPAATERQAANPRQNRAHFHMAGW